MADLRTSFCGIRLRNPILASSGTFGYGLEFASLVDLNKLGGIVVKGLSREPIAGNPAPRIVETASGMLNSVGLQNVGVEAFIDEKLPALAQLDTPVFANVFGYAVDDYVAVIRALEQAEGLAGYELNVSCPNTRGGGMPFGADAALLGETVAAAKSAAARRPLIVKLSPNVTDIAAPARAAEQAGADALSLINTLQGLAVDAAARRPRLGGGYGGLSGPAVKPVALRMVHQVAQAVSIPVIGMGGVACGEDAAEFLLCGASAVQVGTASFWDPARPLETARELDEFCEKQGIAAAAELIGALRMTGGQGL